MKIAAVTNTPLDPSLGSGKTVIKWTQGLRDLGHSVKVFSPPDFYRPFPGNDGTGRSIKIRLDALRLKNILLGSGFDLIEFYGAEFGPLIDLLSKEPRLKRPLLISHTNGLELLAKSLPSSHVVKPKSVSVKHLFSKWIQPFINHYDLQAFAKADCFVSICKADTDYIVANQIQPLNHCATIEPGIDNEFLASNWQRPKQPWIVTLGSWTERKDPTTIIKVVSSLLQHHLLLEFHVIGASGSASAILQAFPQDLRGRIVVHSRCAVEEIVDLLTQCTIFLFPSLYEGFGMATAEAMACGCAVVVTPTGFGADLSDGVDGFVCSFQDAAAMLFRCEQLLVNENLRQTLAQAGRKRVRDLAWSGQVRKLELFYQQTLLA